VVETPSKLPCPVGTIARLAGVSVRTYVADERFAANYEKYAVGLTAYFSAAIEANANARAR
jgi:hypothetical protein